MNSVDAVFSEFVISNDCGEKVITARKMFVRLVFLVASDPGTDPFSASLLSGFIREFPLAADSGRPYTEQVFHICEGMDQEQFDRFIWLIKEQYPGIVERMRSGRSAISVKGLHIQCRDEFSGLWFNAAIL